MKIRNFIAGATLLIAGTAAHAATVSLSTADPGLDINLVPGQDFVTELTAAGATHLFSGPLDLNVADPVKLTFSLVAAESGFQNSLLYDGTPIITETLNGNLADFTVGALEGQVAEKNFFGGDLADILSFSIRTFNPSTTFTFDSSDDEFGVFTNQIDKSAMSTFFIALDDSGSNNDDNHDDIIVRVDVAPVPLPASGLLLLAGLGGVYGSRRFRRAA